MISINMGCFGFAMQSALRNNAWLSCQPLIIIYEVGKKKKKELGVAAVRAGVGGCMTKSGRAWPRSGRQCIKLIQTRPVRGSGRVFAVGLEQDSERQATK